jgi:NTP-dependent ternary system trypsin peptidase co-occuring protein
VSQLVEVPLADGGSVFIEADAPTDAPTLRGLEASRVVPPLAEPLEQILAGLGPATRALLSQVRALTDTPHGVEIEFAIKLTADARIVIARAGGEANFRILLKWAPTGQTASPGEPAG